MRIFLAALSLCVACCFSAKAENPESAESPEVSCGGAHFQVIHIRYGFAHNHYYVLGAVAGATQKKLLYSYYGGYFNAGCITGGRGRPRILLHTDCGGSGCIYQHGIIDPKNLRFLRRPSEDDLHDHYDAAGAVLKMKPEDVPTFDSSMAGAVPSFCCKLKPDGEY